MDKKVLVVSGDYYAKAIEGILEISTDESEFIKHPERFGLVLFTGGEDVSPELYNDTSPKHLCYSNKNRDNFEAALFKIAVEHGIIMTGICRGLQFLNVMSGGKMMHNVNGHAGSIHSMTTTLCDIDRVNSLHHQMVIPPKNAEIIAWSSENLSDTYIGFGDEHVDYDGKEIEAVIYPETKSFGVQYHPEMMHTGSQGYLYFYNMVLDALNMDWKDFVHYYKNTGEIDEKYLYNSSPSQ